MKHLVMAGLLATFSCAAFAQTSVQTETRQTTVETHSSGGVTTVQTTTVVRHYVTYLYDTYVAVGIPQNQIVQLIDLDLDILRARVAGNFDQVRVLVRRQVDIVGVPVVERIHTHVVAHPVPSSLPVYASPVWVNNVTVQNNNVEININNETEIKNVVKQNNINVETLNVDTARQAVKAGKIEELKVDASADADTHKQNDAKAKNADGTANKDADASANNADTNKKNKPANPNETPKAGETPMAGDTPKAGESPATGEANPASNNDTMMKNEADLKPADANKKSNDATPSSTTPGASPSPTSAGSTNKATPVTRTDTNASGTPASQATPAASNSTATPSASSSNSPSASSSATPASQSSDAANKATSKAEKQPARPARESNSSRPVPPPAQ